MPNQTLISRYRAAGKVCGVMVTLVGACAVIGWIIGNDALKGGSVQGITMKTNTALGLLLSGLSLLLLAPPRRHLFLTILGKAGAFLVMAIGVATLSEHIVGWDLGIDQALFREPVGAVSTASPNRMGPVGASCLSLIGLSMLLLDWNIGKRRSLFQPLAFVVMILPMISILGYVFQVKELYGIAALTGIALNTSIALVILGAGVLLSRPEAGFMGRVAADDTGALLIRRLMPAAVLVPIGLVLLRLLGEQAGLYGTEFGFVLLVMSFIVVFTSLVWRAGAALREADSRKDQFLATLAHELRNPLAPVRNAVQLLRLKGDTTPDSRWAHGVIDRQVDHLSRLIEDLTDLSRISRNKLELRKTRVALPDVIAIAIESSRPLVEAQRHRLSVKLPDEPISFEADEVRLAQVLSNLITNAAKYTPPEGKITLTAERDGPELVLRVTDTGMGLVPEQLPRLFEMFYQVEDPLRRTSGGLGIGLALVRHLVELHGGRVAAYSAGTDRGSEFTVRLPLVAALPDASPPVPRVAPAKPALQGRRILVVDDNRDAAISLEMLLRASGAETSVAHDGESALELILGAEYQIALLDIGLPKMNGYDLAREIRKCSWGSKAMLVALTGWGQAVDRERSKDAGFDHHLVKPVDPAALMKLLETASPPGAEGDNGRV